MPIGGNPLTPAMRKWNSQPSHVFHGDPACRQGSRSSEEPHKGKIRRAVWLLLGAAVLGSLPVPAGSQSLAALGDSSGTVATRTATPIDFTYTVPTQRTRLSNYAFDTFGPYPFAGAAIAAGIDQFYNSPPEWNHGVGGYAKRFGSDFGIAAAGTTTRYALSEAFKEDSLYYRCECRGILPRLRHAMVSTLTARRGEDGHLVFSVPSLVAPYAGSITAIYGWYPNRFGAKDAFRTGNYSLLAYAGGNIALEFFYSGPHSLLSRMHLNNAHGSPIQGPNR